MSAYETDYAAIGLPSEHGQNAFTHCPPRSTRPDSHETPAKRWPKSKKEQMPSALMTDAERLALRQPSSVYQLQKITPAAQVNCHVRNATANINTETMAQSDKTAAICRGRI